MPHLSVRFDNFIESVLRVPPFFIVDEILKSSYIFPVNGGDLKNDSNLSVSQTLGEGNIVIDNGLSILFPLLVYTITVICCLLVLLTVALNVKELITVYFYLISVSMVYFSFQRNVIFLNYLVATETYIKIHPGDKTAFYSMGVALIQSILLQCVFGFSYQYLNPVVLKYSWLSKTVLISFLSPSILSLLPFPRWILENIPFNSMLLLITISTYTFWSNILAMSQYFVEGWKFCRSLITGFGLPALGLLLTKWSKLHLTAALRIFWIIRLLNLATTHIMENDLSKYVFEAFSFYETVSFSNYSKNVAEALPVFVRIVKSVLINGCETYIAVVGMATFVSYICRQIGYFFQNILLIDGRPKNFGIISGAFFCILAIQTGLTSLVPEERFALLNRSFCLLFSVMLRMIYKILNPLLVSLSALHKYELHRHVRALIVSAFLILYPAGLLVYLWRSSTISTWLLGISAFNLKIIVKMIISLTIYFLFIVDFYRGTFWEELDDYVYYIHSFDSTIELGFGIFIFSNGAWILFYESSSVIRAVMMCLYAYFNIWYVAKSGWSSYMKRRVAVKKIDNLLNAKNSQVADLEDVCAICYQQMKTAKITTCGHYFHAICLRKWLYLQDYCPICRNKLYTQEETKDRSS